MSTNKKRSIADFFTSNKKQKKPQTPTHGKENIVPIQPRPEELVQENDENISKKHEIISTENLEGLNFERQKWIDGLSQEEKGLLDLEINTMDPSWLSILHKELTKPYFLNLKIFLKTQYATGQTIFPPKEDIYSWTRLTPVNKVKVLILGQDPYHNYNQAHGLAFSVKDPKIRTPPSLVNIYKCLKKEYPDFEIPKTANLTKWSQNEGILLLNTCLTVKAHNANSHAKKGWETFTMAAIRQLINFKNNSQKEGFVMIAWGTPAQKTITSAGKIDWKLNLFLKSVHPSPLSASRGFFDCKHFTLCNKWLYERYGSEAVIDWTLIEGNVISEIEDMKRGTRKKSEVEH